jgi:hypothetical protein
MFTLVRATNFHCPVFLQQWRKAWSYSTPLVFEEFQQSFRTFKALNQQLVQKVYKCVNMFLETDSVLRKKGSRRPTKSSAENIEEGEQKIIAEINPRN